MTAKKDKVESTKKVVSKEVEESGRKPIKFLPPRVHVSSFINLSGLSEMEEAGFKVFCKKEWMREHEWQEELKKYKDRKKKKNN